MYSAVRLVAVGQLVEVLRVRCVCGVASSSVVVLDPWPKCCGSFGVAGEDLPVGLLGLQGAVEPFHFGDHDPFDPVVEALVGELGGGAQQEAAQVGGPLVGHRGLEGPRPASSQRPVAVCSRAQVTTAVRSSPYLEPLPESYCSSRATPRSRSRTAPALFPRAACVRPTQIWARPCHKSRSSPGPAFQRASRTSCAAKGLPSRTKSRARSKVCDGGSGFSETGSTPVDP